MHDSPSGDLNEVNHHPTPIALHESYRSIKVMADA